MQELVVVWFVKNLFQFAQWTGGWKIAAVVLFVAAMVLQIVLLSRKKPGWVLPGSFLAGEVCCELFFQTIDGSDAQLFAVCGAAFLVGLLGTMLGNSLSMIWAKIRRS